MYQVPSLRCTAYVIAKYIIEKVFYIKIYLYYLYFTIICNVYPIGYTLHII